jgi:hypothetical protein
MRVNLRACDLNCAGPLVVRENQSRREPDESSPVRSAGLAFLKSIRPGRNDRQMLAIAEPRGKSKAQCFDRPCGTDLPFTSFPNPSGTKVLRCWMKSIPKEEIVRIRNNFPRIGIKGRLNAVFESEIGRLSNKFGE